jgi:hypothetical protein
LIEVEGLKICLEDMLPVALVPNSQLLHLYMHSICTHECVFYLIVVRLKNLEARGQQKGSSSQPAFGSVEEAYEFYNLYSWEVGFGIRYGISNINKGNKYKTKQIIECGNAVCLQSLRHN